MNIFSVYNIFSIMTLVLTLLLGGYVYLSDRRGKINKIYFFMVWSTVFWIFFNYMADVSTDLDLIKMWSVLAIAGPILTGFFFYRLSIIFPKETKVSKFQKYFAEIGTIILLLLVPTKYNVTRVYIADNGVPAIEPGFLYVFFLVYFVILLIVSFKNLYRGYSQFTNVERLQVFYISLGVGLSALLGLITNLALPIIGNSDFVNYGPYSILIFFVFSAYAIIKYHLFDIKVVATELFVTLLSIFIFLRMLLAESIEDKIINGVLFLLMVFFGIFLIRSVLKEVKQREEISRLAEDLRKANLELKKLDQLKSEFVSLASHQLRTPLTVIKGYISMIQEGSFGAVPENLKETLRKIYISNERLIGLVGDFLNLSRIESGKLQYLFQPINLEEITSSVYEEFKEVAKEKKLELTYEHPDAPLPQAMIDKDKFRQVIMNLLDNAVKYTKRGFIKLKISLDSSHPNGIAILLSISDSGIGMNRDDLEMIFKRFSRGEQGFKANTGGLGLGLYLAKRIISDHGGEIWATSDGPGEGSTFWVRVPARAEQIKREEQFREFISKI